MNPEEVTVTIDTVAQAKGLAARQARGEILITDVQFDGMVPEETPTMQITINTTEGPGLLEDLRYAYLMYEARRKEANDRLTEEQMEAAEEEPSSPETRPVLVPPTMSADVANSLYGDRYGIDWEYVG